MIQPTEQAGIVAASAQNAIKLSHFHLCGSQTLRYRP